MAGNTVPRYPRVGFVSGVLVSGFTGTNFADSSLYVAGPVFGTNPANVIFTSDSTNGSFLQKIIISPVGTSLVTTGQLSAAGVYRFYFTLMPGDGLTTGVSSDLWNIGEITVVPELTTSKTVVPFQTVYNCNMDIPANCSVLVSKNSTDAGSTETAVIAIGGHY